MEIYTSYFGKIAEIKKEFKKPFLINIARYINVELSSNIHTSIKEFQPSTELLNKYKNNLIDEHKYNELYIEELSKNTANQYITKYTICPHAEWFDGIFLLCYESSKKFCHRHILRDFLSANYNLDIKEY